MTWGSLGTRVLIHHHLVQQNPHPKKEQIAAMRQAK